MFSLIANDSVFLSADMLAPLRRLRVTKPEPDLRTTSTSVEPSGTSLGSSARSNVTRSVLPEALRATTRGVVRFFTTVPPPPPPPPPPPTTIGGTGSTPMRRSSSDWLSGSSSPTCCEQATARSERARTEYLACERNMASSMGFLVSSGCGHSAPARDRPPRPPQGRWRAAGASEASRDATSTACAGPSGLGAPACAGPSRRRVVRCRRVLRGARDSDTRPSFCSGAP